MQKKNIRRSLDFVFGVSHYRIKRGEFIVRHEMLSFYVRISLNELIICLIKIVGVQASVAHRKLK